MELGYSQQQKDFRTQVRNWMNENVPAKPLQSLDTQAGFQQHREWERTLYSGGWSMVTWPEEYGGRGLNLIEWLIFEEEYYRANAPVRVNQNGLFLLGPTLMEYGTAEQKSRLLPPLAAGDAIWAQGWSEPSAGSDMAAIRCRAERRGDQYIINGYKTWSTRAVFADWLFGMFRTDPASERHRGLSFLLLPLDLPGLTVSPVNQLDGLPGFGEIYFDNVAVAADNLLGDEGAGWQVAMATAGFERGLMLRSPARFQEAARRLVELYRQVQQNTPVDASLQDAVRSCWMRARAYALATYATASQLIAGGSIGSEASANKIFWSELDRDIYDTAMQLLGNRAELTGQSAVDGGRWLAGFLFSRAGPIYAGTNEIQRNIIGERVLGLPRK